MIEQLHASGLCIGKRDEAEETTAAALRKTPLAVSRIATLQDAANTNDFSVLMLTGQRGKSHL